MKRYDSYQQSLSPWIEFFPSHWENKRMRYLMTYEKGKNPSELFFDFLDGMEPYLSMDFLRESFDFTQYAYPVDKSVKCKENDIVLLWDGSNAGEFIWGKNGILCSTCAVIKPKNVNQKYFWYQCKTIQGFLKDMTNGMGVPHVDAEVLKNLSVLIPSSDEQEAIADYLDRKCASIDGIIATQERRIALLNELKQSVITEAVTRGINPDAPLRYSGIDWIGQIPEHWEVTKLRRIIRGIQDGTHGTFHRVDSGEYLLSAKNVFDEGIIIGENESLISEIDKKEIVSNGYPKKGDIVICCVGTLGRCCLYEYDYPLAFQRSVTFIRVNKKYTSEYLLYLLKSNVSTHQFETSAKTSAQSGVYLSDLKDFTVLMPPISEQLEIVNKIKKTILPLDSAIAKAKREIELLREYKQSVITEAVTGKIKVC